MKTTMTSHEAHEILTKYVKKSEFLMHMRETEVIMRALARHFGEDEDLWGNTGLLHDLDYELIEDDYKEHAQKTVEILKSEGYDIPDMFQAILAHAEVLGHLPHKRLSRLDYALAAAENISGFIYATALMRPNKLDDMEVKSVTKKLKDKAFAASVSREFVNDIEKAGLDRAKFLEIAIGAMRLIKNEIFA